MKDKALWQKVLIGADLACTIVALVTITVAMWMVQPESGAYMLLRFVSWALMGVHFVMHAILNWKEHRWLAIFDVSAVAFVLILVVLSFLR